MSVLVNIARYCGLVDILKSTRNYHHHHYGFFKYPITRKLCSSSLSSPSSSLPIPSQPPPAPTFSLQNYPNFNYLIQRCKQTARCSLVLEDCTRSAFVWHQPEPEINSRFFNSEANRIHRWRCGDGSGKQKRFLLVEFDSLARLKTAVIREYHSCSGTRNSATLDPKRIDSKILFILDLHQTHKMRMYDRMCFIRDSNIDPQWKSSLKDREVPKIVVQNESNRFEAQYQIELIDPESGSPQITIPFEDFNPLPGPARLSNSTNIPYRIESIQKLLEGHELLTELQFKIRFFILHQMEQVIRRASSLVTNSAVTIKKSRGFTVDHVQLMDHFEIVPFGSEVSGFGSADSDLDLCLIHRGSLVPGNLNCGQKIRYHRSIPMLHTISIMLEQPIKFQDRARHNLQLHHYTRIYRIFRAFVPIIKCRSFLLPELNIDVSVDTERNTGVQMAGYLHHCACVDPRVRPFVLLLKYWARHHRIIQSVPGEWFSSFQLTALGLAFLQNREIIPNIQQWKDNGQKSQDPRSQDQTSQDQRSTEESREPTIPRIEDIGELLGEFFNFMISFDFWRNAFDLNSGLSDLGKPHADRDAIYVVNPFLPQLNICKTVSEAELERFLSYCQQSSEIIQKAGGWTMEDLFQELNNRLQSRQIY